MSGYAIRLAEKTIRFQLAEATKSVRDYNSSWGGPIMEPKEEQIADALVEKLAPFMAGDLAERDAALDDVGRLMRQRNSIIFAVQCFAARAEGGLKEDMHNYLDAAGYKTEPDHDLTNRRDGETGR